MTRDRQPVVVVGTPGKLMDHAMEGSLSMPKLSPGIALGKLRDDSLSGDSLSHAGCACYFFR